MSVWTGKLVSWNDETRLWWLCVWPTSGNFQKYLAANSRKKKTQYKTVYKQRRAMFRTCLPFDKWLLSLRHTRLWRTRHDLLDCGMPPSCLVVRRHDGVTLFRMKRLRRCRGGLQSNYFARSPCEKAFCQKLSSFLVWFYCTATRPERNSMCDWLEKILQAYFSVLVNVFLPICAVDQLNHLDGVQPRINRKPTSL